MSHPCRGFRLVFRFRETGSGDPGLLFKGLGVSVQEKKGFTV